MSEASFLSLASQFLKLLSFVSASATPILDHRLSILLRLAAPLRRVLSLGFGNIGSQIQRGTKFQGGGRMIALVSRNSFDVESFVHRLQMKACRHQAVNHCLTVAVVCWMQLRSHDDLVFKIHHMLGLVRQMSSALLQLADLRLRIRR